MTTGSKTVGFQFRLTEVSGQSFQARTKQNVKKRIENIVYLQTPPDDSVKLEYVGSSEISTSNNLYIGDRSDSLYENSRAGRLEEFIADTGPVEVANNNFIMTQEFQVADSGDIPLYYSHSIKTDYTLVVAESIRIYDKDFKPVGSDKFKVVLEREYNEETGAETDNFTNYIVFNNLKSSFDDRTGEYEIYFIQYTKVISGNQITETELLNNQLAYREGKFEDIWHSAGSNIIKPWERVYLYDPSAQSISLAKSKRCAVKYESSRQLGVHSPARTDRSSPWFTRIANGSFSSGGYSYSVPEFRNQAFNPLEPYKTATYIRCKKIDDKLIKLPNDNIQVGELFSSLYFEFKLNGTIQYAVTNDPSTVNTDYLTMEGERVYDSNGNALQWTDETLLGVDTLTGIVNVTFSVLDSYEIHGTYSYKEDYYELTTLNMNPLFDRQVANEIRCIYIVPRADVNSNLNSQSESIRWIKISSSGRCISTNQDGSGGNENISLDTTYTNEGYSVSGILGLHYNSTALATTPSIQEVSANGLLLLSSTTEFPSRGWVRFIDSSTNYVRYVEYIDKTNLGLELAPNVPYTTFTLSNGEIELVNFIDEYTTLSGRGFSDEDAITKPPLTASVRKRYFSLAELSVNPPHGIEELVRIDIRKNGGGIIKDKYDEAKAAQPQVQWYNDFGDFDGQPHPGNATEIVKLPARITETISELNIEDLVDKSVTLGVKPLVRYYGYEPEIISVLPVDDIWGFGEGPFGNYPFGG